MSTKVTSIVRFNPKTNEFHLKFVTYNMFGIAKTIAEFDMEKPEFENLIRSSLQEFSLISPNQHLQK